MSARATGSYDTSRLFALDLVYHCAFRLDGPRHRPSRTAYLQIVRRCARWRPPEKMNDTQRPTSSHGKEQRRTWSAKVILRLPLCTAVADSSVLLAQRQLNTVTEEIRKTRSLHSSLGSSAPASATLPVCRICTTPTVFIVSESQAPVVASRRDVHHPITTEAEEPIGRKSRSGYPNTNGHTTACESGVAGTIPVVM